jgi:hypothetical protein
MRCSNITFLLKINKIDFHLHHQQETDFEQLAHDLEGHQI